MTEYKKISEPPIKFDLFRRRLKPALGPIAIAFRAVLSAFVKAQRLDGDPQRFATMPRACCPECHDLGEVVDGAGCKDARMVICPVCDGEGGVRR